MRNALTITIMVLMLSSIFRVDATHAYAAWSVRDISFHSIFQTMIDKFNMIGRILSPSVSVKENVVPKDTSDYYNATGDQQLAFAENIIACINSGKHPVGTINNFLCVESSDASAKLLAYESFVRDCVDHSVGDIKAVALGYFNDPITWGCMNSADVSAGLYTYAKMPIGNSTALPTLPSSSVLGSATPLPGATSSASSTIVPNPSSSPGGVPSIIPTGVGGHTPTPSNGGSTPTPSGTISTPTPSDSGLPSVTPSGGGRTAVPTGDTGSSPSAGIGGVVGGGVGGQPNGGANGAVQKLAWGGGSVPICKNGGWC